jgi:hypothetical protein
VNRSVLKSVGVSRPVLLAACSGPRRSQVGFKELKMSSLLPINSFGMRETRYAPVRWAYSCRLDTVDTPERPERIEPASDMPSSFLKRRGGAKSSDVKTPDLRS